MATVRLIDRVVVAAGVQPPVRVPGEIGESYLFKGFAFRSDLPLSQSIRIDFCLDLGLSGSASLCQLWVPSGQNEYEATCLVEMPITLTGRMLIYAKAAHIETQSGHWTLDIELSPKTALETPSKPCSWCNASGIGLHPISHREIPGGCTRCAGQGTIPLDQPEPWLD